MAEDGLWKRFVDCVGRDELRAPELERNQSRVERYGELRALLEEPDLDDYETGA